LLYPQKKLTLCAISSEKVLAMQQSLIAVKNMQLRPSKNWFFIIFFAQKDFSSEKCILLFVYSWIVCIIGNNW
jgi:hypothetical protein